jgi:DNA polymerase-1
MARFKKVTDEDFARLHIRDMETETLSQAMSFIDSLTKFRSVEKLQSTYFKGVKTALENTASDKIYCDYRIEGTVTGRLSCGAYKAPVGTKKFPLGISFHTVPRDAGEDMSRSIRQLCIAPNNEWFITADYKAMELRVLAHVANETNMIKAFVMGEDLHKYTASLIYEKNIEDVTKEERQIAKSVSFLVVYGGGAWKLSKTANVSLAVAERTIAKFQEVYPRVFTWMEQVKAEVYEKHYATSMFGRRRNLPDITSPIQKIQDRCLRQAINFEIQSPASDIVCFSVLDIADEFELRRMKSGLLGTVHDSVEAGSPSDELEEALQIMYHKMTKYPRLKAAGYNLRVPIEIEVEIGRSFSGGTEVKFDKTGSVLNREIFV